MQVREYRPISANLVAASFQRKPESRVLDFVTANSEQLYVVTEFVFEGPTAQSVFFRNIKYKGKVYGLDFGPYIDDQGPNFGTQVTETTVER